MIFEKKEGYGFRKGSRRCYLSLAEKLEILIAKDKGVLNKISKIIMKGRQKNKFYVLHLSERTISSI